MSVAGNYSWKVCQFSNVYITSMMSVMAHMDKMAAISQTNEKFCILVKIS